MRIFFLFFIYFPFPFFCQNFPGQKDFQWPDFKTNYEPIADSLKDEDAIILSEDLTITSDYIKRRRAIKILNEKGKETFKKTTLPESFDITNYPNFNLQGRFKNRKDAYVYEYNIEYFSARIIKPNKKIIEVPLKYKTEKVTWIIENGMRVKDNIYNFNFPDLETGDILEYTYKSHVKWDFSRLCVYPNEEFPKLNYNLTLCITNIRNELKDVEFILPSNINLNEIKTNTITKTGYIDKVYSVHKDFLKPIYYPNKSLPGLTLPYFSFNHGEVATARMNGTNSNMQNILILDPNKWYVFTDTIHEKIYDKYHAALRKYISKIKENTQDTSGNIFACQLTDSLNNLRFLSAESMYYSGKSQYSVLSTDLLLKGSLAEEFIYKNYGDLLSERGLFYYDGILFDNRRSIINQTLRKDKHLENKIIVIPEKNKFRYYVPRYNGLKYFPDELPFYFEGTTCALKPCTKCNANGHSLNLFFITTPKSNCNENVRSENAVFKVLTDSFKIYSTIKENLSGQFSTLLRHYYNNDYIDSTVSEHYFKKCTDKPNTKNTNILLTSCSKNFPFKQSYKCSGTISLSSKEIINMTDWFSFLCLKENFTKIPNHNYYFDFEYTDIYNYLFEFDKPVEITSADLFTKKLINSYFEVSSSIVKQDEQKYLFNVSIKQKQRLIPASDCQKIIEFATILNEINLFKLNYKPKQ